MKFLKPFLKTFSAKGSLPGRRHGRRRPLRFERLEQRQMLAPIYGDFNGDGYDDLAIGIPYEDIGAEDSAGAVQVLYGCGSGLDADHDELWYQGVGGGSGAAEAWDYFGQALGVGDFNGDGYDDLAIGVPGEDIGSITDAGLVQMLYGSSSGLTAGGVWYQGKSGVTGVAENWDHFGQVLAVGDFDGDGHDDLAISVPDEDIGSITDAGLVQMLYGSSSGLTPGGGVWFQGKSGVTGVAEDGDYFGEALAVGDFDGDGHDDLAIGVPSEDIGSITGAGLAQLLYGSSSGLTPGGGVWYQGKSGVRGVAEDGDSFGEVLAVGDFDGDGHDDLAIGVPYEDVGPTATAIPDAGVVQVLYGTSSGLTGLGDDYWSQGDSGVAGGAEDWDNFGYALAVGDFDGDGHDDLAIGVPFEDVGAIFDAGGVQVLYGSSSGLTGDGDDNWHQDKPGMTDTAEAWDFFGYSLAAGDFGGDGRDDLAIGIPGEDVGGTSYAGAVHVLYGSPAGLSAAGDEWWHQDSPGVLGTADAWDYFGYVLA